MKKILVFLTLLFVAPLIAFADDPKPAVLTLETTLNNNTINYSGTTESGSHAVMCKLLDNSEKEINRLSVEVVNNAFSGSFVAPARGEYTVYCANYEGGSAKTANANIEDMAVYTVEFIDHDETEGDTVLGSTNVEHGSTVARPEDPTKDDLIFDGWYQDVTLLVPFEFTTKITGDTTLYAKWRSNVSEVQIIFFGEGGTYQVEFDTDNPDDQGPMNAPITSSARYFVAGTTEVTLTAIPSEGHHFVGWHRVHEEDIDGQGHMDWVEYEIVSDETEYIFVPDADYINLKPVFEADNSPERFTVTFNSRGGTEISPINVDANELVARPGDPANGDKIFRGWYEDETCLIEFDFNTPITRNITLYAKWDEPVEDREMQHLNVWATDGGKVAVVYIPSEPNVYDLTQFNGTNFVALGEILDVYAGDEITVVAKPDDGYRFVGWFHINQETKYEGEVIDDRDRFTYEPGVTMIDGDDSPLVYICAVFEEIPPQEDYELSDEAGNEIAFTDDEGQDFSFMIVDLSKLGDEELTELTNGEINREQFNEALDVLKDAVKEEGTFVSIYEIVVVNDNGDTKEKGPFTIRIKMTDEMKDYKSFKLLYVDTDNGFEVEEVIDLDVVDGYLVGTLEHLSSYVLVGNATSSSNNPKTLDNIYVWIITLLISIVGLTTIAITSRKQQNNGTK